MSMIEKRWLVWLLVLQLVFAIQLVADLEWTRHVNHTFLLAALRFSIMYTELAPKVVNLVKSFWW